MTQLYLRVSLRVPYEDPKFVLQAEFVVNLDVVLGNHSRKMAK